MENTENASICISNVNSSEKLTGNSLPLSYFAIRMDE